MLPCLIIILYTVHLTLKIYKVYIAGTLERLKKSVHNCRPLKIPNFINQFIIIPGTVLTVPMKTLLTLIFSLDMTTSSQQKGCCADDSRVYVLISSAKSTSSYTFTFTQISKCIYGKHMPEYFCCLLKYYTVFLENIYSKTSVVKSNSIGNLNHFFQTNQRKIDYCVVSRAPYDCL